MITDRAESPLADASAPPPETVAEMTDVSRRYGSRLALDHVSLALPAGVVTSLIGPNGAGKTTLIRHLLGLLQPQSGEVRVFGADPVADPVGVLSRIGYLSEEDTLPGWMRVNDLLKYLRALYPTWDEAYARRLVADFALDATVPLRSMSKGQRARAGLVAALVPAITVTLFSYIQYQRVANDVLATVPREPWSAFLPLVLITALFLPLVRISAATLRLDASRHNVE